MMLFGIQALLAIVLEYGNRIGNDKHLGASNEFLAFRNNYLVVYCFMMGKKALLFHPCHILELPAPSLLIYFSPLSSSW